MDNSIEFYRPEASRETEQLRELPKLPYSCAECQHVTELNRLELPICESCGHNILYKTRNKKFLLVFDGR